MKTTAFALVSIVLCVSIVGAGEVATPQSHTVYANTEAPLVAPVTSFTAGSGASLKDDPIEYVDRDEFLGQVQSANAGQALSERVDPFSGSLHLGTVDVVLPGSGGLNIVIQRYYDAGAVWNRVDNAILARHAASADMSGHLGDTGWQMHMGKLMNVNPGPESHTTFIMADGSTHPLYNRDGHAGEKITPEGWLYQKSGNVYTVTTTTGLTYTFDDTHDAAGYTYFGWDNGAAIRVVQCTRVQDLSNNAINVDYEFSLEADGYASLIRKVSFDPDDSRSVEFEYNRNFNGNENWLLWKIRVKEGVDAVQTWVYLYGDPQEFICQPQYSAGVCRGVASLTAVVPPEGNSWGFEYYPADEPLTSGPFLLKTIRTPRFEKITYTWGAEAFDTGLLPCAETPTFLAAQTRQTSVYVDATRPGRT
jgi:hypothetical protein